MLKHHTIVIIVCFSIVACILFIHTNSRIAYEAFADIDIETIPHIIKPAKPTNDKRDIPFVVYQSWNTYRMHKTMHTVIMDNARNNPEFEFKIYDDAACRSLISDNFSSDVVEAFDKLKPGAYKSDLWRLCALYKYGGIYMDIKFKVVTPLKDIIGNSAAFVQDLGENAVYQGFFIAKSGDTMLKKGIDKIVENVKNKYYGKNWLDVTGPDMLGPIIKADNPASIKYKLTIENNIHRIVSLTDNKTILQQYESYRNDQLQNGSTHYSQMWDKRDIYN